MSRAQLVAGAPIALAMSRFRFTKLRRLRPRPYALWDVQPEMPRILWSEGYGQGLTEIALAYGHPHEVNRPLIQVQTCFSEEDCGSPSLEEAIARAEHRDACFARREWMEAGDSFDPFPALPVPYRNLDHDERILAVDGEERAVTVVSHGDYAALQLEEAVRTLPGVRITTQIRDDGTGRRRNEVTNPEWPAAVGRARRGNPRSG